MHRTAGKSVPCGRFLTDGLLRLNAEHQGGDRPSETDKALRVQPTCT